MEAKGKVEEFATASELLAGSRATKVIDLKLKGKKIKIKKVLIGDLAAIMQMARNNEIKQTILLVFKGLVEPKLKLSEVESLEFPLLLEIGAEIRRFSGLDEESVRKISNLLGIQF